MNIKKLARIPYKAKELLRSITGVQRLGQNDQAIVNSYTHICSIGHESTNRWIKRSSQIPGWIFEGEHEFIYEMCMRAPHGDFIEIGVLFGKATSIISGAIEERGRSEKLFAIDPFTLDGSSHDAYVHKITHGMSCSFDTFQQMARKHNFYHNVIPVATYSHICIPSLPIDVGLAMIDGCHEREAVELDLSLVCSRLVPGGIILLHDAANQVFPGVMQAIENIKQQDIGCREIGRRGTIVALEVLVV